MPVETVPADLMAAQHSSQEECQGKFRVPETLYLGIFSSLALNRKASQCRREARLKIADDLATGA